jgi:molybdopterin converting factor subunit 1
MRVQVLFFGVLKDIAGSPCESFELPEGSKVSDLLSCLASRIPAIIKSISSLAVAVNQRYAGAETTLNADDEIALLPPVSGGLQ